jgi:di/tricarboxylate transporter
VEGTWEALDQNVRHPDLLVVDSPDMLRRQVSGLGRQGKLAIAVLAAMVVLLAFGLVPPVIAGLLAAGAMIMLRVVRLEQIYRAMPWTIVILIGGLIPLSTGIKQSGAADEMARVLVDLVGEDSPYLLLIAIFVLVAILGAVVSNVATPLIVAPIAVSAATGAGVSVQTVLMAVAVGAAASFLTPISTPGNMMVMGPGGYRFGDSWKLGLPLTLWFLVVAVFWVPVIWPF